MKKIKYVIMLFIISITLVACGKKSSSDEVILTTDFLALNKCSSVSQLDFISFLGEMNEEAIGDSDTLSIDTPIQSLVDEIGYEESYNDIEKDHPYKLYFDLNNLNSSKAVVDKVMVNDSEKEFNLFDDRLSFEYTTPSTVGVNELNISILYHDSKNKYSYSGKYNIEIQDNKYEVKISNAKAADDKYTLDCNITSLKNNNGNLFFVVSDGNKIINEIELNEGLNHLELNVILGNTYEYAIINKNSNGNINAGYYKGVFSSLLPIKVVINDITSSSATFKLQAKNILYPTENLKIDGISYDTVDNVVFGKNNLDSDKLYKVELEYDFNGEHYKTYKTFKTLKSNQTLVDHYMDINEVTYTRPAPEFQNGRYSWNKDTYVNMYNVKEPDETRRTSIFLDGHGSVNVKDDRSVELKGGVIEIVINRPSLLNIDVCSTGESSFISQRLCNLTNGRDFYSLEVYRSGNNVTQSLYLDSGVYYMYSSTEALKISNVSIKQIMSFDEAKDIEVGFNTLKASKSFANPACFYLGESYSYENDFYVYNNDGIRKKTDVTAYLRNEIIPLTGIVDERFNGFVHLVSNDFDLSLDVVCKYSTSEMLSSINPIDELTYYFGTKKLGIETYYTTVRKPSYLEHRYFYDMKNSDMDSYYTVEIIDGDTVYTSFEDLPKDVYKEYDAHITFYLNSSYKSIDTKVITASVEFEYQEIDDIYYYEEIKLGSYEGDSACLESMIYIEGTILKEDGSAKVKKSLAEWNNIYGLSMDVINNEKFAVVKYNNISITNIIALVKGTSEYVYGFDGVEAGSSYETYSKWDIKDDYKTLGVTMVKPNIGDENDSSVTDGINVLRVYDTTVITSKAFETISNGVICIKNGTKDSGLPFEILVECFDDNDNVVFSQIVKTKPDSYRDFNGGYYTTKKVTNIVYVPVATSFNKVRLSGFKNASSQKYLGIISIDIYRINLELAEGEPILNRGEIIGSDEGLTYDINKNVITFTSGVAHWDTSKRGNYVLLKLSKYDGLDLLKAGSATIVNEYENYIEVLVQISKMREARFTIYWGLFSTEYIVINNGLVLEENPNASMEFEFNSKTDLVSYNDGDRIEDGTKIGEFKVVGEGVTCNDYTTSKPLVIQNDNSSGLSFTLSKSAKIKINARALEILSKLVIVDSNGDIVLESETDPNRLNSLKINTTRGISGTLDAGKYTILIDKINETDIDAYVELYTVLCIYD